jgi:hypothetical protein
MLDAKGAISDADLHFEVARQYNHKQVNETASRRMRIATFDISRISTTVRRHEALLRYARYLFIFNIVIFPWVAIPQLSHVTSFRGLAELVAGPAWQWAALVLGGPTR